MNSYTSTKASKSRIGKILVGSALTVLLGAVIGLAMVMPWAVRASFHQISVDAAGCADAAQCVATETISVSGTAFTDGETVVLLVNGAAVATTPDPILVGDAAQGFATGEFTATFLAPAPADSAGLGKQLVDAQVGAASQATDAYQLVGVINETTLEYFATIQAAITAAISGAPILTVGPGTCDEHVNISEEVTLLSRDGAALTTIAPTSGATPDLDVIIIGEQGVTLGGRAAGFSVQHAHPGGGTTGALVAILNGVNNVRVDGNDLDGTETQFGVHVQGTSDDVTINDNTIRNAGANGTDPERKAGIFLDAGAAASSNIAITNNTFLTNPVYHLRDTFPSLSGAEVYGLFTGVGGNTFYNASVVVDPAVPDETRIIPTATNPIRGIAATIQRSVAFAALGDRVEVAPGTYDEVVTIAQGITLSSLAGPAATIIAPTAGVGTSGSVVSVTFGGVTVGNGGFTIRNLDATVNVDGALVLLGAFQDDQTVQNNVLDAANIAYAVRVEGDSTGIFIHDNDILNATITGVLVETSSSDTNVRHNLFQGNAEALRFAPGAPGVRNTQANAFMGATDTFDNASGTLVDASGSW